MRATLPALLLLVLTGCNSARYSVSYNRVLPHIETVAILPVSVDVRSIHSGGNLEDRPDLREQVRRRFVTGLAEEIRERGRKPVLADEETTAEQRSADLALVSAVRTSLLHCHYEGGRGRVVDYDFAETLRAYAPAEAEAVLCIDVLGIVPTAGREALKFTATAVGLLVGAQNYVSTNDAILHLMLVELDSGKVVWFHTLQDTPDVRSDSRVRRFVHAASKYLLEPIK